MNTPLMPRLLLLAVGLLTLGNALADSGRAMPAGLTLRQRWAWHD